jgi:hypothetical protein
MAKAYVSYHPVALRAPYGSSVLGPALYSEVLDFTSAQDTTASGLTSALALLSKIKDCIDFVATVSTDADCYIAVGATPDCTLETATAATSARVFLAAGQSIDLFLSVGAKVAAKAVA